VYVARAKQVVVMTVRLEGDSATSRTRFSRTTGDDSRGSSSASRSNPAANVSIVARRDHCGANPGQEYSRRLEREQCSRGIVSI